MISKDVSNFIYLVSILDFNGYNNRQGEGRGRGVRMKREESKRGRNGEGESRRK